MTKKHEELVEEMAKKIWAVQAFPRGTDWDRAVEKAEQFITLILSAVRDGRLDEELGVVGRRDFCPKGTHDSCLPLGIRKGDTLIAFRKKEA